MRFVICDDDACHAAFVRTAVSEYLSAQGITPDEMLVYTTPEAVLANFTKIPGGGGCAYFLDIDFRTLPDGLMLASAIRQSDVYSYIVFMTAHQERMSECFAVRASAFLLKPYTRQQLEQCVENIYKDYANRSHADAIRVTVGTLSYMLPYSDVVGFSKEGNNIVVHLQASALRYRASFKELEMELPSHTFARVHQGYIVNLSRIRQFDHKQLWLTMDNDQRMPVSRRYRPALTRWMDGGVYA